MKVTVVIATFNCGMYIGKCIQSLIDQTLSDFEIIICDDCSTDNTKEVVNMFAQDKRILYIRNSFNQGPAITRNNCINIAKGDYIAIQDADDYSTCNRLEILANYLDLNRNVDFVASSLIEFNDNGYFRERHPVVLSPKKEDFLWNLPVMHATTMFRKDILLKVNGYRNAWETQRGQDYDLFMRIYAANGSGVNINDILYYYRYDYRQKVRRKYKYRIGEAIIRFKGFRLLKIGFKGIPYILKPLVVGLFPDKRKLGW